MELENTEIIKKKTPVVFFLVIILIFILGFGLSLFLGKFILSQKQTSEIRPEPRITTKPTYIYESKPPTKALTGSLSEIFGEVKKQPRDSDNWIEISTSSAVLQGESLKLGSLGKATVLFENQTTLFLGKNSEVSFINLIPEKFMLVQNDGTITFKNLKSVSVKIFDSLTILEEGEFVINVDNEIGRFNLSLTSGSAKLSFVDENNDTKVYPLTEDDNVRYDSATKTVIIK